MARQVAPRWAVYKYHARCLEGSDYHPDRVHHLGLEIDRNGHWILAVGQDIRIDVNTYKRRGSMFWMPDTRFMSQYKRGEWWRIVDG